MENLTDSEKELPTREGYKKEAENKANKKTFFVSSAIIGFPINKNFLESIKTFCKIKNSTLVLLLMRPVIKEMNWPQEIWDSLEPYLYTTYKFNENLKSLDILLSPQQINPLTGLDRYGQKDFSLIVASPKQQMKSVPVSVNKLPHTLWSTGSICENSNYKNNRIGRLAVQDHILGGLVVEINDQEFYIRPIQCTKKGSFTDLNKTYKGSEVKDSIPPILYLGDCHAGWEDEQAIKACLEQIEFLKVKEIFLGDLFDGTSISHHHNLDIASQINRPEHSKTLELELHTVGKFLKIFLNQFPKLKINIIRSNHDEHLDRYLKERRFIEDRVNYRIALELSLYLLDGYNPIEFWINLNYPELRNNLIWLTRDSSKKINFIEIACHGDKGSDGKWGSINNLENSYGSCVVGHAHTPQILRGVYIVGTNTKFDLPYTKGHPSSWLHANCSIYKNGQRQLLISVNGKWKI